MRIIYAKGKRGKKKKIHYKNILLLIVIVLGIVFISQNIKKEKVKETVAQSIEEEIITEENITETTIEANEDEEIKSLIQKKIAEKNLTESNFAFFYYNEDTNKCYFYNENTYFKAASTVKVPVAMLYYDKINNNELTLDSTIEYTKDCYEEGGGLTNYTYKVSDNIPIQFLLEQSIVNSDNTALNILVKNIGKTQYRYDISKYTEIELSDEFYENNITSARYGYDLLKHIYENTDYYNELIEYMEKSSSGKYLKEYISDKYKIAHKYGSYEGNVHDYGIVYGNTTYMIGVYTKSIANASELIAEISLEVSNLVNK